MSNWAKKIIDASPRKSFFTDMLTRDITLEWCILDLVDNSVNWIIAASGKDVTELFINWEKANIFWNYTINIDYDSKKTTFSIVDNWSGITSKHLEKYVFRFWSDKNEVGWRTKKWLSVYWVWMKRTIFKLGRFATLETQTKSEISYLDRDIDRWLEAKDWDLEFNTNTNTTNKTWTKIMVKNLNDDVVERLNSPTFFNKLKRRLEISYSLFIECGLKIFLNWTLLKANLPKIISDDEINFSFLKKKFKKNDPQNREYIIIAGLAPESTYDDLGWNVFCNGRMILHGDKTFLTWWWTHLRQFHSSLNPFVWNIFFTSNDATDLPWNTTKDWINFENLLYQGALVDMKKSADPIIKYLAGRYKQDSTVSEIEKNKTEFEKKDTKTISDILKNEHKEIKFKNPEVKMKKKIEMKARISYQMDKEKIEKVKDVLIERWNWEEQEVNNSSIWEETFNYFFIREC